MSENLNAWCDAVVQSVHDHLKNTCWTPPADVYKTTDGWLIKMDVAGVRPEDIKVEIAGQRMTVSGCRRDHMAKRGLTHHQLEISYNCFQRTLKLPDLLDASTLEWEMDQGMWIARLKRSSRPLEGE